MEEDHEHSTIDDDFEGDEGFMEPEYEDGDNETKQESSSSQVISKETLFAAQSGELIRVMDSLLLKEAVAKNLLIQNCWDADRVLGLFVENGEAFLGGKVLLADHKTMSHVVDESDEELDDIEEESEIVESDLEFDDTDLVEPDNDPPQKMGDNSIEVTEENRDSAKEAKVQAMKAKSEGKLEEAIEYLTNAIMLNPTSALMYATRATVYIEMKKPTSAIRDASAALEINPDSAKGYKARGMALAMLGKWANAAKDLNVASELDFDEEIDNVLKKVKPNAKKIDEHYRKYGKLRKEREEKKTERERQCCRAEAKAAYEKSKKQDQSMPGGEPRAWPTGMPGGNFDFSQVLIDPEPMAALEGPEIMAALQDEIMEFTEAQKNEMLLNLKACMDEDCEIEEQLKSARRSNDKQRKTITRNTDEKKLKTTVPRQKSRLNRQKERMLLAVKGEFGEENARLELQLLDNLARISQLADVMRSFRKFTITSREHLEAIASVKELPGFPPTWPMKVYASLSLPADIIAAISYCAKLQMMFVTWIE